MYGDIKMYIYRVKSGESAASIAAKFGRSESELIRVNPQIPRKIVYYAGVPYTVFNNLYIDQNLVIPQQWIQFQLGLGAPIQGEACSVKQNPCTTGLMCVNGHCIDPNIVGGPDALLERSRKDCADFSGTWDVENYMCVGGTDQSADAQSSPASELTCEKGMHKECTNDDCKCVETSNAIYWVLGGLGVVVLAAIGVSAYRAYRGMPEPGTVWVQGGGATPTIPLREPIVKQTKTINGWVLVWNPIRPNIIDLYDEGKTGWSDQAIRYQDGRIAFDSPERIPVKVRDKVRSMFRKFAGWPDVREPMRVRGVEGDMVWITYMGQKSDRFLPDVKITKDKPQYVLYPMHGYSGQLAVGDENGQLIGWMPINVLGFDNVKEWMKAVNYIV